MVREATRNPYALFAYSLHESDWVLAALIARSLEGDRRSRHRLVAELRRAAKTGSTVPANLNALQRWSELATAAGIAGEPE